MTNPAPGSPPRDGEGPSPDQSGRSDGAFKDGHPDVDWQGINRMRNLAAHHYHKVSHDLVWAALAARVPELGSRLSQN